MITYHETQKDLASILDVNGEPTFLQTGKWSILRRSLAVVLLRARSATSSFFDYTTPLDEAAAAIELDPSQGTVNLCHWNEWGCPPVVSGRQPFATDGSVFVQVFLNGDMLEVFFDQRRSLTMRLRDRKPGALGLMAREGAVTFEDFQLRYLPGKSRNTVEEPNTK